MKIALVSDWYLPRLGGIELQLRDLAVQLQGRGHGVEIITPVPAGVRVNGVRVSGVRVNGVGNGSAPYPLPPTPDGIRVHRLGAPRLPGAGIVFTAGAFRRIRELYEAGQYDVVHVHFGIIAPAAYGATFIAQRMGLPTVATFHSVLTHFDAPLKLVRGLMGVSDWRVQWTAVSSVVAESMRPLVGDAPVTVVPNAIDVGFWSRRSRPRPPSRDPLRAVSVSRLHRRKRSFLLLDAAAAAGGAMRLEIIGDGPEMGAMRRAISRRGLDDVVTMRGWMPQEHVREALHASDVFLLPSRLEAFGIAALEARAAGVPVIAMRAAGVRDFLTDGVDALLAHDDDHFTRLVGRVATDAALLGRLADACAAPLPRACWSDAIVEMESLYRRAAATPAVSRLAPLALT